MRDGHHGYTPANGIPEVREAVSADILKYRNCTVHPDNVVLMPGGKPTMFFAVLMFGAPGKEIIYPNPGFPIYESVINFTGAKAVPMPLYEDNGFSFSADEVLSLITPATSLIIINSPANPTGGFVPREEMDKLAAGLEDHPHVTIMSDEIYSRMLYDGREHVSMLEYETCGTESSCWTAGQNLCHDGLAAGLCGVAGWLGRSCDPLGDQLSFVRERTNAMGGQSSPRGAARRCGHDDGRVCRASTGDCVRA